jgi:class 3 adenylate cyclase
MSSPEGWSVSPELAAPVDLRGLRFTDRDIERDYRVWRAEHVRAFTTFAMYAGAGAAVLAWFAVLFGALVDLRGLALGLIPVIAAVLAGAAMWTRTEERDHLLVPAAAGANLLGGLLAVAMTAPTQSPPVVGACSAMSAYFGLTLFRLPPLVALVSVGPYLTLAAALAVGWHADGTIGEQDLVLGIFIPMTTLVTGMLVNLAMEWTTRQAYLDHLTIETQQDALFEERSSLARFLSPGIAETVHHTGGDAMRCEIYSLTAVSIDLRGFTKYTQRNGAERMVQVLQEYYAAVIEAAEEYGATVKDFAGDGALVLVGAPFPRADHTRAGLRLARDMLVRVREVTSRWETADCPLGAGVGIASGECAVGTLGLPSAQLEYAAVGTAVNLSARLCDIAKDGQILMAAGTARALEESPGWRREIVTLSGIPESVEVTIEETLQPDEVMGPDRPGSPPPVAVQRQPDHESQVQDL